ncbi:3-hydroxybutyryl-CoA dehydrogenase [Sulfitobacter porphyrae]|uniref:3-hydroxybutyryl-CoA dehydrogenase n=1 Tax=Sulfitobacter porphyrae TaxID=1246864 RepID=A0ABW2BBY2_9RHOB|nr:3-hydroxyacyl-CoA dehydrogenase [Sulfitobacter porphyrae]
MGSGIAQLFITNGYEVILNDLSDQNLALGVEGIEARLRKELERGEISAAEIKDSLGRLAATTSLSELSDCQFVIEAATESEKTKQSIFESLRQVLRSDAYLASNTSSLSITRLASITPCPERFMGVHFMNPVPKMHLVELIRGIATSEETFHTLKLLVEGTGKKTAVSEDYPAFIVNRVLIPMINEAVYALYEGVGSVISIDNSMKLGANHPMGPLELGDFIGLDTCLAIMNVLHEGFADTKYRPCPLLVKYVEAGWVGRKSGRGFYDYRGDQPVPTR